MNDMFELADKLKELRDKKQHLAEDTIEKQCGN